MKELKLEVKKLDKRETKTPIATCTGRWLGTCMEAMMESAGCAD